MKTIILSDSDAQALDLILVDYIACLKTTDAETSVGLRILQALRGAPSNPDREALPSTLSLYFARSEAILIFRAMIWCKGEAFKQSILDTPVFDGLLALFSTFVHGRDREPSFRLALTFAQVDQMLKSIETAKPYIFFFRHGTRAEELSILTGFLETAKATLALPA